jgi:hypothetical protein
MPQHTKTRKKSTPALTVEDLEREEIGAAHTRKSTGVSTAPQPLVTGRGPGPTTNLTPTTNVTYTPFSSSNPVKQVLERYLQPPIDLAQSAIEFGTEAMRGRVPQPGEEVPDFAHNVAMGRYAEALYGRTPEEGPAPSGAQAPAPAPATVGDVTTGPTQEVVPPGVTSAYYEQTLINLKSWYTQHQEAGDVRTAQGLYDASTQVTGTLIPPSGSKEWALTAEGLFDLVNVSSHQQAAAGLYNHTLLMARFYQSAAAAQLSGLADIKTQAKITDVNIASFEMKETIKLLDELEAESARIQEQFEVDKKVAGISAADAAALQEDRQRQEEDIQLRGNKLQGLLNQQQGVIAVRLAEFNANLDERFAASNFTRAKSLSEFNYLQEQEGKDADVDRAVEQAKRLEGVALTADVEREGVLAIKPREDGKLLTSEIARAHSALSTALGAERGDEKTANLERLLLSPRPTLPSGRIWNSDEQRFDYSSDQFSDRILTDEQAQYERDLEPLFVQLDHARIYLNTSRAEQARAENLVAGQEIFAEVIRQDLLDGHADLAITKTQQKEDERHELDILRDKTMMLTEMFGIISKTPLSLALAYTPDENGRTFMDSIRELHPNIAIPQYDVFGGLDPTKTPSIADFSRLSSVNQQAYAQVYMARTGRNLGNDLRAQIPGAQGLSTQFTGGV